MKTSINQSINPVKQFFSLKPLVFIGKISYSLYLFHWFFIAFTHFITGQQTLNNFQALWIVVLTFIVSIVSYYLVETPIRHSKLSFKNTFIRIYAMPSLLLVLFNLLMNLTLVTNRIENIFTSPYMAILESKYQMPKIAVIGDSHTKNLTRNFMTILGNKEGWKAKYVDFPYNNCYLKPALFEYDQEFSCQNPTQLVKNYPVVVVAFFYNLYRNIKPVPRERWQAFVVEDFKRDFLRMIKDLAKNHLVIVMGDTPNISRNPVRGLYLRQYGLDKFLKPITQTIDMDKYNAEIKAMVANIPNVRFVDPSKYLPQEIYFHNLPLFLDRDHLTNLGSTLMGKNFIQHERLLTPEEVKKLYP